MLLEDYAAAGSEAAFEELVRRHLDLVFGTALRLAGPALAEDVSQIVFMTLAQKAGQLSPRQSVAGWLHTTTRFVSSKVVRSEVRRTAREREVVAMSFERGTDEPVWAKIKPHLDEGLGKLDEKERSAVLLRFFEGLPYAEVARALRISDDAAQKRVGRALERLHAILAKREPSLTVGALTASITACASHGSPPGLIGTVTAFCSVGSTAITPINLTLGTLMTMKTKATVAGAVLVAGILVPTVLWQQDRKDLGVENETLRSRILSIEQQLQEQEARFKQTEQEANLLRAQAGEVHRLRAEVTRLRAERATAREVAAPVEQRSVPEARQPAMQGLDEMTEQIAELRMRAFGGGEPLSAEERDWLAVTKIELEKLEAYPADFAKFQSELIRRVAGLSDPEKIEQVQRIIESRYQQAVAQGLDLASRPGSDQAAWKQRRHELDRAGTAQVQGLLTSEERALFDRHFLGIMGVDLGTGVDETLYPEGFLVSFPPGEVPVE